MWALVIIIAIAAVFRFLNLAETPPGLWPDEAVNGLNALDALATSNFKVFYADNFGREGLYINLQALSVSIFGATPWALRVVSAFAGTATVAALFFAGRELFRNMYHPHMTALVAALLAAVSVWHVNFSRIGFRAILLPLFATVAVWWMLTALRTRSRLLFAASGFLYGLALSTYIAARFLPILAIFFFVYDVWRVRKTSGSWQWKALLIPWGWCAAGFTAAALPLLGYFATHPADFFGRAGDVSIFAAEHPLRLLMVSLVKTLGMFHVAGDANFRHNLAGSPQLDVLSGILLLFGIAAAISILLRLPHATGRKLHVMVLFIWIGLMLLPGILSSEGVPHALRTLGAIPPIMLLAAMGFGWFAERVTKVLHRHWSALAAGWVLAAVSVINFYQYFFVWGPHPKTADAFRKDLSGIAVVLLRQPESAQKIVVVNKPGVSLDQAFVELSPIRFLTHQTPEIRYLSLGQLETIEPRFDETVILPYVAHDEELFASLRALFPTTERREENGTEYYAF